MSTRIARLLSLLPLAGALLAPSVEAQIAVKNQGYIPFSDAPIFYRSDDIDDPVARLQKQIEQGKAKVVHDGQDHGYLKSVLKLLDVPISSQTLVFSKTSFQYPKISPEHPRALYFNDDVYVGVVQQGKEIELVSFDARQGAIFYLMHEQQAQQPAFERAELDCTQCHIAPGTRGVPGVFLKSVRPTSTGTLASGAPTFITDQESPFAERWGGWYATGKLAGTTLANAVAADESTSAPPKLVSPGKPFDTSAYLAPGSDEVALLVLAHQTQMHNLITLTNYKTRLALHALGKAAGDGPLPESTRRQFERPADQLVRYLLFSKEAALPGLDGRQVIESSAFAREFEQRGPRDSKGRSLRDFDLSTRTFRYPCSYLIYSEAFDALPEPSKSYVYQRLLQVLTGADQHEDFKSLSAQDRRAILEILLETKAGLPSQWQEYARSQGLQLTSAIGNPDRRSSSQRGK